MTVTIKEIDYEKLAVDRWLQDATPKYRQSALSILKSFKDEMAVDLME